LKYRSEALAEAGLLSFHENGPWDNIMGLFGLKISRDVDRASLTVALLMVSLPDFLCSRCDGNHDVGSPFRHFGIFSSFSSLKKEFCWLYDMFLSL
jgi:hypothetical protein